jgi:hypothetical protein
LKSATFLDYWWHTFPAPSSRILAAALAKDSLGLTAEKLRELPSMVVGSAEVGKLGPVPALFQTGYLTVDEAVEDVDDVLYTLRFPNRVIEEKIYPVLSERFFKLLDESVAAETSEFVAALADRDAEKLSELLTRAFSTLAAAHYPKKEDPEPNESFYHSLIFFYCHNIAVALNSAPAAAGGAPDLAILFPGGLRAVVEIKYAKDPAPEGSKKAGAKAETPKMKRERGATAQNREDELEKRRSKLTSDLSK